MTTDKDTEALIERMEGWNRCYPGNINIEVTIDEAATALRAQQDRIEKLEKTINSLHEIIEDHTFIAHSKKISDLEDRIKALEAERDEALKGNRYADLERIAIKRAETAEARVKELEKEMKQAIDILNK